MSTSRRGGGRLDTKESTRPTDLTQQIDAMGFGVYLNDAILLLLQNKQTDPIDFLVDYFKQASEGAPPLTYALQLINMNPRQHSTFMMNLRKSFMVLTNSSPAGLVLSDYILLLNHLSSEFPVRVTDTIIEVLELKTARDIEFSSFAEGINICLIYQDLFSVLKSQFNTLNSEIISVPQALDLVNKISSNSHDYIRKPSKERIALCASLLHKIQPVTFQSFAKCVFQSVPLHIDEST